VCVFLLPAIYLQFCIPPPLRDPLLLSEEAFQIYVLFWCSRIISPWFLSTRNTCRLDQVAICPQGDCISVTMCSFSGCVYAPFFRFHRVKSKTCKTSPLRIDGSALFDLRESRGPMQTVLVLQVIRDPGTGTSRQQQGYHGDWQTGIGE